MPVRKQGRQQLPTDPEMCMFRRSQRVMMNQETLRRQWLIAWIEAMQDELHQTRSDEDQHVIRNKARLVATGLQHTSLSNLSDGRVKTAFHNGPLKEENDDHAGCLDYSKSTSEGINSSLVKTSKLEVKETELPSNVFSQARLCGVYLPVVLKNVMSYTLQDYGFNDNKMTVVLRLSVSHSNLHKQPRTTFTRHSTSISPFLRTGFNILSERIGMRCLIPSGTEVLTNEVAEQFTTLPSHSGFLLNRKLVSFVTVDTLHILLLEQCARKVTPIRSPTRIEAGLGEHLAPIERPYKIPIGDQGGFRAWFANRVWGWRVVSPPQTRPISIPTKMGTATIMRSSQQPSHAEVQDKGKGKMIEPEPVKKMSKKDQLRSDEEEAKRLQAEFDEEERLAREKDEVNVALTKEWDDIQAKIKADHELAQRLQVEEQEELFVKEKAKLFQQLLEQRRKHFTAKKSTKKQKVDEDKDTSELQSLMEVIPDEEEVAIDVVPLDTKPPTIDDPKTFDEAIKSQDVAFWKESINDEMNSILGNNTWVLADLQARLVIHGLRQKLRIDYFDTYAPMVHISTIRLLITMASIHKLIIHQMDVKITLLNGELDEEVYINQPYRFNMLGNENKIPLWSKPIAPLFIRYDNAATLAKFYGQMYNGKSRHLGVRHSMIHELIMNGVVSIEFVRSQQNLADHLTKGLVRDLVLKGLKHMYLHIILRMCLEPAEKEDEVFTS
ncbi:zinc finger, CCHC-type containing protein [Tanacetum coccineum]